jgi:hypothetical protein
MKLPRGVVAGQRMFSGNEAGNGFDLKGAPTLQELYFYIMYWDKVAVPANSLFYFGLPQETDLIEAGVLTRPMLNIPLPMPAEKAFPMIIGSSARMANEIIKDKNTDWVIHDFGDKITLPQESTVDRNSVRVSLTKVLPAPNYELPIVEILDFKNRRSDELGELHESLDLLYSQILKNPDPDLAAKTEIIRLKNALENIDKVQSEKFLSTQKFDLSANLDINAKNIAAGAAIGAVFDHYLQPISFPIGAIIGGIMSSISVKASASKAFTSSKEGSKLSYLSSAYRQGIIN